MFILSKGHAAPILYAAWAEAGLFPRANLLNLRNVRIEAGRPSDASSAVCCGRHGIAGPGIVGGIGMALAAKLDQSPSRIYVLMGDGETAEGSVWEAAHSAAHYQLDNLCATVDINRLGQSDATIDGHDLDTYRRRFEAFGWNAVTVDGHDLEALLDGISPRQRDPGSSHGGAGPHYQREGNSGRRGQTWLSRQGRSNPEEEQTVVAGLGAKFPIMAIPGSRILPADVNAAARESARSIGDSALFAAIETGSHAKSFRRCAGRARQGEFRRWSRSMAT